MLGVQIAYKFANLWFRIHLRLMVYYNLGFRRWRALSLLLLEFISRLFVEYSEFRVCRKISWMVQVQSFWFEAQDVTLTDSDLDVTGLNQA